MIQIKNRYSGNIIKEVESLSTGNLSNSNLRYSDLRHINLSCINLRGSDLRDSDLSYSNLSNSNLNYSDLRGSDLRFVIGNGIEIKSLQIGTYMVSYHKDILNIGCQSHKLDKWINFTDEEIDAMDRDTALDWWKLNKDILVTLVKREIQ